MEFGYLPPPAPLAHIVKAVWYARGARTEFDDAEPIVPDGCVELIFNLADPFEQIDETGRRQRQPCDLLVGPSIRPTTAAPTGDVDLLGLRFRPGRTSAFLRAPMWRLANQIVSMSSVIQGADRLLDDLHDRPIDQRLDRLTAAFVERAPKAVISGAVAESLNAIDRSRGIVSVKHLSSITGVSRRHLERRFRDEVGLGAKHVARIARVHHAMRVMQAHPSFGGADIAARCGYTDQAHLIREFRELTGATPTRLATTGTTFAALMREEA